ncbi:MAG: YggS family pyridoxal phosphate-dependent enzyme, partial [Verrucomicrobiota bacterium]
MSIQENLEAVRSRIADAERSSGRETGSTTLVAVSKTWPVEVIQEAVDAGQRILGENKVQEVFAKVPAMQNDLRWHFIGHLQKNKTRKVLPLCSLFESVDSIELARQIDRIAGELELKAAVLIQVNVSEDEAKFGFSVAAAQESWSELLDLPNLEIRGLMTVPAFDSDPEKVRPDFVRLRELRGRLEEEFGNKLPELS